MENNLLRDGLRVIISDDVVYCMIVSIVCGLEW